MTPIQAPDSTDPKWSERLWLQALALLVADLVATVLIASLLMAIIQAASLFLSPEHHQLIAFLRDGVVLSAGLLCIVSLIALSYRRGQLIRTWKTSQSADDGSGQSDTPDPQ